MVVGGIVEVGDLVILFPQLRILPHHMGPVIVHRGSLPQLLVEDRLDALALSFSFWFMFADSLLLTWLWSSHGHRVIGSRGF